MALELNSFIEGSGLQPSDYVLLQGTRALNNEGALHNYARPFKVSVSRLKQYLAGDNQVSINSSGYLVIGTQVTSVKVLSEDYVQTVCDELGEEKVGHLRWVYDSDDDMYHLQGFADAASATAYDGGAEGTAGLLLCDIGLPISEAQLVNMVRREFLFLNHEHLTDDVQAGRQYGEQGFSSSNLRAAVKLELHGTFRIPAMTDGYQYMMHEYVSDSVGTAITSSWRTARLTDTWDGTYVLTFRHRVDGTIQTWTDEDSEYVRQLDICHVNDQSLESRVIWTEHDLSCTQQTLSRMLGASRPQSHLVEKGSQASFYMEDIAGGSTYDVSFVSASTSEVAYLVIYAYADTSRISQVGSVSVGETTRVELPAETTRLLFTRSVYVTEDTWLAVNVTGVVDKTMSELSADVDALNAVVFPSYESVRFANVISTSVLVEMYFPAIDSDWKLRSIAAKEDYCQLSLIDDDGNVQSITVGSSAIGAGLRGLYSDLIHTWVDSRTSEVVGYFIIHYTGEDYVKSNSTGYGIRVENVTDINKNPRIKEYLSRNENIVLLGDDIMERTDCNILAPMLRKLTNKKVFNCCLSQARMALCSDTLDALSYVSVSDAIYADDYSALTTAAAGKGQPWQIRCADLKAVNWRRPTTVIVAYGNNDIVDDVAIGELWQYTDQKTDYVKSTLLGAMNYGIANILGRYPLARLLHFTTMWHYRNGVPPYAWHNGNGDSDDDYNAAIKENARRLGITAIDLFTLGGCNEYNRSISNGIMYDETHFNVKGYERLAMMLASIANSYAFSGQLNETTSLSLLGDPLPILLG